MYDSCSSLEDKMGGNWLSSSTRKHDEEAMEVLQDEQDEERDTITAVTKSDDGVSGKNGKEGKASTSRFPEEDDEEILKESNSRFVLFPIKYREVSSCS
jgi:ribonucleoside-diphosphate reductase subunit M2